MRKVVLTLALCVACHGATAIAQSDPVATVAACTTDASQSYDTIGAQHSHSLGAKFIAQWMVIYPSGQPIYFWGARIVGLDPASPLQDLGLRVGDVITRLDGLKISTGMHQHGPHGGYHMPELDRHFGLTEVRYIFSGTQYVNVGTVLLNTGGGNPGPGGPVQP